MKKLINKLYFTIILGALFLFSCGKCSNPLNMMVMDGPQPMHEDILFTFIQTNFDTTDIFYSGLFSEDDLEAFVIHDDNTLDTIDFNIYTDYQNKKRIVQLGSFFYNYNLRDTNIEFRLNINSEKFIIPISFTKTHIPWECRKGDTYISNIKVDNPGHSIINENVGYIDEPFYLHNVTLVVPRSEMP